MDHSQYYIDMLNDTPDPAAVSVYGAQLNKRNVFPWWLLVYVPWLGVMSYMAYVQNDNKRNGLLAGLIIFAMCVVTSVYVIMSWQRRRQAYKRKRERLYRKLDKLRSHNLR